MIHPLVALLILAWALILAIGYRFLQRSLLRRQTLDRVRSQPSEAGGENLFERSPLAQWLYLAGYRDPASPRLFVSLTVVMSIVGMVLAYLAWAGGLTRTAVALMLRLPGGIGDLSLPVIYLAPWLFALLVGSVPWIVVRSARRRRTEAIAQDLPVTLELLATLSEAGLGFDAALAHVLESQTSLRPLAEDLQALQADILASRPRIECFRRLGRRVQVPAFSVFISAVVQAEQIGAGVAGVLRRQADDLRQRRREDAMGLAMALPIKRLFPMIICFMPGIFVVTLGPTLMEFLRFADGFLRGR